MEATHSAALGPQARCTGENPKISFTIRGLIARAIAGELSLILQRHLTGKGYSMAVCSDENTWFLAQLKPNCAQIANRNLRQQGFGTFLPLEERTQQRNGRFKTKKEPLFPGYIFVSFDVTKGLWHQINSTYGINRLIGIGMNGPTEVPTAVVTQLMDRCDDTGTLLPPRILKSGDQVLLTTGPFANFLAEVERTSPDGRVWILMDMMGSKTRVSVACENLSFA